MPSNGWGGRRVFGKVRRSRATQPAVAPTAKCSFCGVPMAEEAFCAATLDRLGAICARCLDRLSTMSNLAKLSGMSGSPPEKWAAVERRIWALMERDVAPLAAKRAAGALVLALCHRTAKLLAGEREGLRSRLALVCDSPGIVSLVKAVIASMGMCVTVAGDAERPLEGLADLCVRDPLMVEIGVILDAKEDHGESCALVWVCQAVKEVPPGAQVFVAEGGPPGVN